MKFLIIEDDQLLANALRRAAQIRGHEADTALTGKAALEKLNKCTYDAVLSDLMLPDMTGVDVYEQAPEYMRKRFVFETGTEYGPERDRLDALKVTTLTKPARNETIFSTLESVAK